MAARQRTPHPSPLQMIAICNARAMGMSAHEIHRRTGHSNASALRWFDAWGHDAKTFDNWVREYRIDISGHTFDDYFPIARRGLVGLDPVTLAVTTPEGRFKTTLGLK